MKISSSLDQQQFINLLQPKAGLAQQKYKLNIYNMHMIKISPDKH